MSVVSRPRTVPRAVISAAGSSRRSASPKFIAGSMCPAEWPPATTTRGALVETELFCKTSFPGLDHGAKTPRLRDGKIEVGVRVGLVFQRVVPPLAAVGVEATVLHDGAEAPTVSRLGLREGFRAEMRAWVHQV